MEQTKLNGILSFMLRPYRFVMSVMLIGLSIVSVGTTALQQSHLSQVNPFSELADIFPGQPESALERRGFYCFTESDDPHPDPIEKTCQFSLKSGIFFSIQATTVDATIHQISFVMREDLTVGEMALFMELSDFHWTAHMAHFKWRGHPGYASTSIRGRAFFRPIWQVTFTNAPS